MRSRPKSARQTASAGHRAQQAAKTPGTKLDGTLVSSEVRVIGRTLKLGVAAIAVTAVTGAFEVQAADKWWPFPIYEVVNGEKKESTYEPLEKAAQKWNICVLFPHMKDSFWVAVAFGVAEEAKRLGVQMTLLQAGGYENLPKQISQWDDCVASGAQAIVTGAISEAGMAKKCQEGLDKGIPQISTVNPVADAKLTAKVFV
jgi:periplasmic protein TorT